MVFFQVTTLSSVLVNGLKWRGMEVSNSLCVYPAVPFNRHFMIWNARFVYFVLIIHYCVNTMHESIQPFDNASIVLQLHWFYSYNRKVINASRFFLPNTGVCKVASVLFSIQINNGIWVSHTLVHFSCFLVQIKYCCQFCKAIVYVIVSEHTLPVLTTHWISVWDEILRILWMSKV